MTLALLLGMLRHEVSILNAIQPEDGRMIDMAQTGISAMLPRERGVPRSREPRTSAGRGARVSRSLHERLEHLAQQVTPHAPGDHLQRRFTTEASDLLDVLDRLAWGRPSDDERTIRAEQLLDACRARLHQLRRLPKSAPVGYVAYTARSLARDLDMVFYLLSPRSTAVP
jgi:hypothetical protein